MSTKPPGRLDACRLELRRTTDRLVPLRLRNALYTTKNGAELWTSPVPVSLLSGQFRGTDEKGTVLTAGPAAAFDYWTSALFESEPARESLGTERMPGLRKLVAKHRSAADITLVRMDDFSAALWRGDGYLPCPEWVGVKVRVPASEAEMRRMSRSARDDIRLLRRRKLHCEFSNADEDLVDFYENLYRPFTLAKYGPNSFIPPMNWFWRHFRSGGVVWVVKDGVRVSGMLVANQKGVLDCMVLGIRNGDLELIRQGVLAGLYVGVIRRAMSIGAQEIDLRGCRPALMDGVLRYKLKWKGELYRRRENVFHKILVYWPHANSRVRSFLSTLAPVFLGGNRMMAVGAIAPEASCDDIRKLERLRPYRGLDKLGILVPGRMMPTPGLHPSTVLLPDSASSADVLGNEAMLETDRIPAMRNVESDQ